MNVVSSFLTFPGTSWWVQALKADTVILDRGEYFQKMSYRNRYRISGANNSILLSLPLVEGRGQHTPMDKVLIHNGGQWQTRHWRSLVSVYNRTPIFSYYEHSLAHLFATPFTSLIDFNRESILWAKKQLALDFDIQETGEFLKQYPGDVIDLRSLNTFSAGLPKYYQVFEERLGFLPDLSILDLLFSEGPAAAGRLKK
jgi:hypothetical protein